MIQKNVVCVAFVALLLVLHNFPAVDAFQPSSFAHRLIKVNVQHRDSTNLFARRRPVVSQTRQAPKPILKVNAPPVLQALTAKQLWEEAKARKAAENALLTRTSTTIRMKSTSVPAQVDDLFDLPIPAGGVKSTTFGTILKSMPGLTRSQFGKPASIESTERVLSLNDEGDEVDEDGDVMAQTTVVQAHSPSPSLDILMNMTSLEPVKMNFVNLFLKQEDARQKGLQFAPQNLNLQLHGHSGTGKTTVAKLYSSFLKEIGLLNKSSKLLSTTGAKLLESDGEQTLEHMLQIARASNGGVIMIEDADKLFRPSSTALNNHYLNPDGTASGAAGLSAEEHARNAQLSSSGGAVGSAVVDLITTHSVEFQSEGYGPLVWILLGTANLLQQNETATSHSNYNALPTTTNTKTASLVSHFPRSFYFAHYNDDDLQTIFSNLLDRCGHDITVNLTSKKSIYQPLINLSKNAHRYELSDTIDAWGNLWKYNDTLRSWTDAFDNISPIGIYQLGSAANPIISKSDNRTAYLYDTQRKGFYLSDDVNGTKIQTHYPGQKLAELDLLRSAVKNPKYTVTDEKWVKMAIKRLGKLRIRDDFSNARAVKDLFETTLKRQSNRLVERLTDSSGILPSNEELFTFTREDLLGPPVNDQLLQNCKAWHELQALEGLEEVQASVRQLIELAIENRERELHDKPQLQIALNRVFLGNPGTGKTTVAKLYARILADLGLLSKGDVILKTPSDFKGNYIGNSESQTRAILESAKGSVLVIDEAYGLNPSKGFDSPADPYSDAIISTIVEQVQGVPGEDRAVVMLGYKEEMERMISTANPGLARRFQMENAFVFKDFSDEALVRILVQASEKEGIKITPEIATQAITELSRAKALPNFGNAGAVMNLLSEAKLRLITRQKGLPISERVDEFVLADFVKPVPYESDDDLFSGLVGIENVKEKLNHLQNTLAFAKRRGKVNPTSACEYNYVMTGSPGTGKTTVARLMGKMFCRLGLIPSPDVVEVSATDLITGYVGQAGKRTREILTKARGKVLLIDEAYQLNPRVGGGYMREVVDELVKGMTSEEFQGKLVIILAGYEGPIDEMLSSVNPGLKSRFSERIHFEDFSPEKVALLLRKHITADDFELSEDVDEYLPELSAQLVALPHFAFGRDALAYYKKVYSAMAARSIAAPLDTVLKVEKEDLMEGFEQFVKSRTSSTPPPAESVSGLGNPDKALSSQPQELKDLLESLKKEAETEKESNREGEESVPRDPHTVPILKADLNDSGDDSKL